MDKLYIKSQSAIEFLSLAGVVILMFIMLLGITANRVEHLDKQKEIVYGEALVIKVQKEINLAARSLDGYSRTFEIPQKLGALNYSIDIVGAELNIDTAHQSFTRRIPNVIGNIAKGANKINKTDGTIYIN